MVSILVIFRQDRPLRYKRYEFGIEDEPDGLRDFLKRLTLSGWDWQVNFRQATEQEFRVFTPIERLARIHKAFFQGKEVYAPWLKKTLQVIRTPGSSEDQFFEAVEGETQLVLSLLRRQKRYAYSLFDLFETKKKMFIIPYGPRQ